MRHKVDHRKLGRTTSHRKALLRNLATSLVRAERIETTTPKAKELRRLADHLITLGKEGSLHSRRQAARILRDPESVKKLFETLAPRFTDRKGGYTRIFKFGFRRGDSAEMSGIEYLGYQLPPLETEEEKEKKLEEGKKAAKKQKAVKKPAKKAEKTSEEGEKKGLRKLFGGRKKKEDTKKATKDK